MASAGSIYVDLLLNDGKYVQGLNRSKAATSNASRSWQKDVNKTRDSFISVIKPVENVSAAVSRLGGIIAASLSIKKVVEYSDSFKNLQSRLGLVTDSAAELNKVTDSLFNVSQDNFQPIEATIDAYSRLGMSLNDTQKAQVDLIKFTDLLSKTLLISGTNASGAATFFQQFGQAASSDFKAIGQELQTFADQNPRFYGILRDEASKYGKTLKKMAEDGELSFEFIANATLNASDQIESDATRIAVTVQKSVTQLNNSLRLYIGQSEAVSSATGLMAEAISGVAGFITLLAKDVNIADTALTGLTITLIDFYIKYNELAKSNAEKFNFFGLNDESVKEYEANISKAEAAIDREGQALLDRKQMIQDYLNEQQTSQENPITGNKTNVVSPAVGLSGKEVNEIHKIHKELDDIYAKYESQITGISSEFLNYSKQIDEVSFAYDNGRISAEEYYTALKNIDEAYDDSAKKASAWSFDIEEAGVEASRGIQRAFADFLFDPFQDGLDGMLMGFLNTVKRMAAEAASAQILAGLFGDDGIDFGDVKNIGGSAASSAKGFFSGLFDGFFAGGGYIKPGHFGIAGEAGAEMIYGGNTGATVIPQGGGFGGGTTVNIINNAGASVSQSQRQTSNGMELDVMIDQAVAEKIGMPGSKTNRALSAFNSRSLTRR